MPTRRPAALQVHLFEAPVGGGRGDSEEIREAAGRRAAAGFAPHRHRYPARPASASPLPRRRSGKAMTVAPWWEVTCGARRPGRFGAPGPWAPAVARLEAQYGPERTLHVSLEEFARLYGSRRQLTELWREGGVPIRELRQRGRGPTAGRLRRELDAEYRRFRGFSRPNLLVLFPTWAPSPAFSREYPAAILTGPLWPTRPAPVPPAVTRGRRRWLWYASPASAERLIVPVADALAKLPGPTILELRTPRPLPAIRSGRVRAVRLRWEPASAWHRRFRQAHVRIVTGSRSLLEAIRLGGPFLYFNGCTGQGRRARRHRPEKIEGLLALARRESTDAAWRGALARFSQGRSVDRVVRWVADPPGRGPFPPGFPPAPFPAPRDDAGHLLVWLARRWAATEEPAEEFARAVRRRFGGRSGSNS